MVKNEIITLALIRGHLSFTLDLDLNNHTIIIFLYLAIEHNTDRVLINSKC